MGALGLIDRWRVGAEPIKDIIWVVSSFALNSPIQNGHFHCLFALVSDERPNLRLGMLEIQ